MLAYVVLVPAVMAYMYPKGYEGGSPALEGYKFGACIGLIFIAPIAVILKGIGTSVTMVIIDLLWHTFAEQALVGLVIGIIYGRAVKATVGTDDAAGDQ